jgi:hypothetical protein
LKKVIFLCLIMLLFFQCTKNNDKKPKNNKTDLEYIEKDNETNIDFTAMKKLVDESSAINIEVFFAISVLHKHYISQFINEIDTLSEDEQKDFFQKKKVEFFQSIKYTEDEYNDFMQKNMDKMNDYINSNKDIEKYLTTIN